MSRYVLSHPATASSAPTVKPGRGSWPRRAAITTRGTGLFQPSRTAVANLTGRETAYPSIHAAELSWPDTICLELRHHANIPTGRGIRRPNWPVHVIIPGSPRTWFDRAVLVSRRPGAKHSPRRWRAMEPLTSPAVYIAFFRNNSELNTISGSLNALDEDRRTQIVKEALTRTLAPSRVLPNGRITLISLPEKQ